MHFEEWRSMLIWLLESRALELKINSKETNWRRYDIVTTGVLYKANYLFSFALSLVTQRIANPCTPVRFQYPPPEFLLFE